MTDVLRSEARRARIWNPKTPLDRARFICIALGVATGMALLLTLTYAVGAGQAGALDQGIAAWLAPLMIDPIRDIALTVTVLGNTLVVFWTVVVAAVVLTRIGRPDQARFAVGTVVGAAIATWMFKAALDRPRPLFEGVPFADGAAYPSGHTSMTTVLALSLAIVLARLGGSGVVPMLNVGVALLIASTVGLTRIILGVHHPTDVIAGLALGIVWTAGCAALPACMNHLRPAPHDRSHTPPPERAARTKTTGS